MPVRRTVWHYFFGYFLRERGPSGIELRDEVPLSEEPLRMDYLLLRKLDDVARMEEATTLRRLWPLLPRVSVVEFKSISRPFRTGNLDRLWGYTHVYFSDQRASPRSPMGSDRLIEERHDLCALLVVPSRTPSLDKEIGAMGLTWQERGPGYWQLDGGLFALFVVEIDVVGLAEGDDLLRSFGHLRQRTAEIRRFWARMARSREVPMSVQEMEDYDDVVDQFIAELPPEKRLVGLDRDHQALALPLEILRALSEDYLRTLSPEVQAELRRRLNQNGH
ncbi:MAG: hypothetical protein U0441_03765 [Polyangiaceae bacterium]